MKNVYLCGAILAALTATACNSKEGTDEKNFQNRGKLGSSDERIGVMSGSLLKILVMPEDFDGKEVIVTGFIRYREENFALYTGMDVAKYEMPEYGIWIDMSGKNGVKVSGSSRHFPDGFDLRPVILHGRFSTKRHGHMGLFVGEITVDAVFELGILDGALSDVQK